MLKRPTTPVERGDSSGDRLLAVLALFTIEQPEWTVEAAADKLGVSATTSYRYFQRLTKFGLISPVSSAGYTLGPAIIQMDRLIQISDPMLSAARGVMTELIDYAAEGSVVLLCRLFHDRVMCVHQVVGRGPQSPVSYERGRPMPLFRGATARIILAFLPTRSLKSLFAHNAGEIAAAGLGGDWTEFRDAMAKLRREGFCVSRSEIDPGRAGLAAPIFNHERAVLGSLSFVLQAARADATLIGRLAPLTMVCAREIEHAMLCSTAVRPPSARVKLTR